MDTQTLRNIWIVIPTSEPVQACSRDYGFDYDEEEIAREMLAQLPAALSDWALSQTNADEMEFGTLLFLS